MSSIIDTVLAEDRLQAHNDVLLPVPKYCNSISSDDSNASDLSEPLSPPLRSFNFALALPSQPPPTSSLSFNSLYLPLLPIAQKSQPRRFIVYLEPCRKSRLFNSIQKYYLLSKQLLGPNEANLYHPHCSMTGFITIEDSVACPITSAIGYIQRKLDNWLSNTTNKIAPTFSSIKIVPEQLKINLGIHVDQFFHNMIHDLQADLGHITLIREKPMQHMSLAYNAKHVPSVSKLNLSQLETLLDLAKQTIDLSEFEDDTLGWDVVFHEQTYQSLQLDQPHSFKEIARWPVFRPDHL
ncbi:hypothetical protein CONCODRAFT_77643 [Conidiobolus coronatus NRRL 28638]|uniref:Uncharacterized protein n=1 Tax=Conidiobolus coronatus (strain ATCC 28846 / CBS 209.66 / NRRL 28638) TaxID=796925 RepID=A0A137PCS0_CONC2|nr:hypothetical protein CONCODRAFT_77643 [Conidiobolus coronatus NRRL 28638]|eukprot:KXN72799.1 hypothetical protein CONCODRAFT_77643 [Conidiobolus coronatus NRRL 28638]